MDIKASAVQGAPVAPGLSAEVGDDHVRMEMGIGGAAEAVCKRGRHEALDGNRSPRAPDDPPYCAGLALDVRQGRIDRGPMGSSHLVSDRRVGQRM
jgi:hypothetical protein